MRELVDVIRQRCAEVARRARHVHIEHDRIPGYARSLPREAPVSERAQPASTEAIAIADTREHRAAFGLTLNAINFGSGWFPTLRKRRGLSGYNTIAGALRERFDRVGAWSAEELSTITATELAGTLDQDPDHELMALFARALNDLGTHVKLDHGGRFEAVVDAAGDSAVALAGRLSQWRCFADTSRYDDFDVPFLKRAQIAAADLQRAGVGMFTDIHRLTIFADNLVPHVLRLDGILSLRPELVARIDREELIEHGSPEEVEIRACALHAVELIVAAAPDRFPAEVDQVLWLRGGTPPYKARPRHRSRCNAY